MRVCAGSIGFAGATGLHLRLCRKALLNSPSTSARDDDSCVALQDATLQTLSSPSALDMLSPRTGLSYGTPPLLSPLGCVAR